MVDSVITKQELIDAQKDAQTLEDVVNGESGELITTRLGRQVYTLASIPIINAVNRDEINGLIEPKADKVQVAADLLLKADKSTTYTKAETDSLVTPKADQAYVDSAVGAISTDASKQYATLALANADIASINLNQNVFVSEAVNGGYWYKATAGATSLTKSPYDPLVQSKTYIDTSLSKNITRNASVDVSSGNVTLTDTQANLNVIYLTGTLAANVIVTFPKKRAQYIVFNATTGGFAVALKTLDQSSAAIELKPNEQATIYNSDSDVRKLYADRAYKNGDTLTNTTLESSTASIKNADDSSAAIASTAHVKSAIDWKNSSNAIALTDIDKTLTASDLSKNFITFTGALTVSPTVTLTTVNKMMLVRNDCNFDVLVRGTANADTIKVKRYDSILVVSVGGFLSTPSASVRFDEYLRGAPTTATTTIDDDSTRLATTAHVKSLLADRAGINVINLTAATTTLTALNIVKNVTSFTTSLSDSPTVIFPNTACIRIVRNASSKTVILKGSAETASINLAPNKLITLLISGTVIFKVGDESSAGSVSNYKGRFKYGENYFVGDIVEHGSGVYRCKTDSSNVSTPYLNGNFEKLEHNLSSGANRKLSVKSSASTAIANMNRYANSMSNDGLICFGKGWRYLELSLDWGKTFLSPSILDAGTGKQIEWVRQLNDGQLMVQIADTSTVPYTREIKKTTNWTGGTTYPAWVSVMTITKPYVWFADWSFSQHNNIVLLTEYGAKTGVAIGNLPDGAAVGENARYVYMSTDYGKTFKVVFDLNTVTDGVGVHLHGSCYDPYWNRLWVGHGDGNFGSNGLFYSDDFGTTWSSATETHNAGVNFPQSVHIVPLPECILLASDAYPNGVHRIDRAQGKTPTRGWYELETAYYIPNQATDLNFLCQSYTQAKFIPNMPYLFGFSSEKLAGKSTCVATFNGWDWFEVWTETTNNSVGAGIRSIVGVTYENTILISSIDSTKTPQNALITVKVDID